MKIISNILICFLFGLIYSILLLGRVNDYFDLHDKGFFSAFINVVFLSIMYFLFISLSGLFCKLILYFINFLKNIIK